jgi:carbon-monoxide dehydrogenase catalytic subunit
MDSKERSSDKAAQMMIEHMAEKGQQNAWDRLEAQMPQCGFGKQGICCRICAMGPCRISKKASLGVCGADVDTIVARNFLRAVAAGVSAHSDHGRTVAEVFLSAAKGEAKDYQIKDVTKLRKLAQELGVEIKDRSPNEIAVDIGHIAVQEFGKYEASHCTEALWEWTRITKTSLDTPAGLPSLMGGAAPCLQLSCRMFCSGRLIQAGAR